MSTCVRCGLDLSALPEHTLWWQGVPGAKDGVKGDLCDPCHEKWGSERAIIVYGFQATPWREPA